MCTSYNTIKPRVFHALKIWANYVGFLFIFNICVSLLFSNRNPIWLDFLKVEICKDAKKIDFFTKLPFLFTAFLMYFSVHSGFFNIFCNNHWHFHISRIIFFWFIVHNINKFLLFCFKTLWHILYACISSWSGVEAEADVVFHRCPLSHTGMQHA